MDGRLTQVHGEFKQILAGKAAPIDEVYFPVTAVVSIMASLSNSQSVEIATVGNEGFLGVPLFLGSNSMAAHEFCQVQVPGLLVRMKANEFLGELQLGGGFSFAVRRYVRALFTQISQQVACNGVHPVSQRCSRWLLLTHDRVGADQFPMTQEALAQILGVRRASVTLAAGALQKAGVIRYQHGLISIVNREGLEATSCECYGVIRTEFNRLVKDGNQA